MAAAGLDLLVGDPLWLPHPVVMMGNMITFLRLITERIATDQTRILQVGGGVIALILIGSSGFFGWLLEHLALVAENPQKLVFECILLVMLASCLATRSLYDNVMVVLKQLSAVTSDELNALQPVHKRLRQIVGRDVYSLSRAEILRATSETAAENAVDGIFAPLFWMLVGCAIWMAGYKSGPGPLSLALIYKASNTLDSMLGYRRGKLRWLGTASARLDDCLTWIPARLVLLTLPLVSQPWHKWLCLIRYAQRDGALDPSPNAGLSEAIFAHCIGIRMGGGNYYAGLWVDKPVLAAESPPPVSEKVQHILHLSIWLEVVWLAAATILSLFLIQI